MNFLAYFLAFLAAVSNAAANVLQRAANRDEDIKEQFSFQLIWRLLHKPIWFLGIAAITVSFLLQAFALGVGTLAAVQPLLVLELPVTLIASARFLGSRLGRREWLALCGMTAGTVALIAFLGPSSGKAEGIRWWVWFTAIAGTAAVIVVTYWLGHHWQNQARRAAVLGIGTGASYGLAAALMKGMTQRFSGGILSVLTSWQLYGAIAAGVFAIWMHQNALGAGRLAVVQPGVTLTDPYLSIVWGAFVFGETMRTGFWIVLAIGAATLMTGSVITLARSADMTGLSAQQEEGHRGAGRPAASGGG